MNRIEARASKKAMAESSKRDGYLNAYMAIESDDRWTATTEPNVSLRFRNGYLYRKTVAPYLFGGYVIHRVIVGSRIADEWLGKVA